MINLIKKLNIKTKLRILFLLLCFSISILGYKSVNISEDNKETLKVLHSKTQIVLILQDKIITPLYKLRQLNQSLIMAPNNEIRTTIQYEINKTIENLDKNLIEIKEVNNQIIEMWESYKEHIFHTKRFLDDEFEEGAYINVTTVSKNQFDLLVNKLLNIQEKLLNNSIVSYSDAVNEIKKVKVEVFSSVILILTFAIIIGWLVSNNILKSIYSVQDGLNDFFKYLKDKKTRVEKIKINSTDEFGQMASLINENVSYISKNVEQNELMIKNATKILENIKGGNLGTRLSSYTNDVSLNELKKMINDMIDNLEDKIQKEINQRIEQEQILIQQSKLAAMGEMIGNIAHQWRQPLAQIAAIHINMKVTYEFNKFDKKYLDDKIKEASTLTSYMSQTINDFQNFFKPQGEKEFFLIKKACEEAFYIIESSLKYHGINFEFNVIEDSEVLGYKNEYSQVILNILSNAKDIFLERKIEKPKINLEIKVGENYSIVKIQDNAGGVEKNILDKIFEPYFTTRHKNQGTGIGLYMAKNIIERNMNGFINVRNYNNGALFTVKVLLSFQIK